MLKVVRIWRLILWHLRMENKWKTLGALLATRPDNCWHILERSWNAVEMDSGDEG